MKKNELRLRNLKTGKLTIIDEDDYAIFTEEDFIKCGDTRNNTPAKLKRKLKKQNKEKLT